MKGAMKQRGCGRETNSVLLVVCDGVAGCSSSRETGIEHSDKLRVQPTPAAGRTLLGWLLLAGLLCGCASAVPDLDPVRDAAMAVGVADAIVIREDAEPIDSKLPEFPTLTIADAVRAALQHDPRLQEALAVARVALAGAHQARRWPNPILDIVFRFPEGGGRVEVDAGIAANVLAILQTPTRASAADHRLTAACAGAVATAIDVLADTQASYVRLQTLEAEVPLLEAQADFAQRLAAIGRARLAAGDSTQLDLVELDALRLRLELEAAARGVECVVERVRLARLLGVPSTSQPLVLAPWQEPSAVTATEERLLAAALKRRPELAAARAEIQALGDDLDRAGLSWLAGASLGAVAEREEAWSAGPSLSLPLPLFDGGSARLQGVRAEILAARHRATALGREIVEATRRALATAKVADAALGRVRMELLPMQQRRRNLAEAAWRAGAADLGPLLRAEQELRAAEATRLLLQRDQWLARIALERAVGGPTALAAAVQPVSERKKGP